MAEITATFPTDWEAPQRGESEEVFSTKANAAWNKLRDEIVVAGNLFGTEANAVKDEVNDARDDTVTAKDAAVAAASTAQSTANATLWISGQSYSVGENSISLIDFQTYRATVLTSGTTDPSLSADWTGLTAEDATKLPLAGGTMTGAITSMRETRVAMGANDIDLASGNYFTKTISAVTTLTVSNVPTTGQSIGFILELTNGGSSAVTWFAGIKWAGGKAPTLTSAGVDTIGFITHDAGTTWYAYKMGLDMKAA